MGYILSQFSTGMSLDTDVNNIPWPVACVVAIHVSARSLSLFNSYSGSYACTITCSVPVFI